MPITLCALRYQAREQHMQHVAHKHSDEINQLRAEIKRLRAALEQIEQWVQDYPLIVFTALDLKEAARVIEAGGIPLAAVTATSARFALDGVQAEI
jgi:hypothetical protein